MISGMYKQYKRTAMVTVMNYIPITLTNNQASATVSGFQQQIYVTVRFITIMKAEVWRISNFLHTISKKGNILINGLRTEQAIHQPDIILG